MQKATADNNKLSTSGTQMKMSESYLSPQRKKISQQSIREFKIEIDHQIAKCLDTLDRQGLKFLKETLRTSNIFNSTNLEVQQKNECQESLNSIKGNVKAFEPEEQPKNKLSQQQSKSSIKKDFLQENKKAFMKNKEPKKQVESKYRSNSSVKIKPPSISQLPQEIKISEKAKANQRQKKIQMTQIVVSSRTNLKQPSTISRVVKKTVIQNKKTNDKASLGQKINKKLQQLNIKNVGPGKKDKLATNKSSISNFQRQKHNEPQEMIEEDIVEIHDQQPEENLAASKEEAESQSIINSSIGYKYRSSEIKISQKINPLKPFSKDKIKENEITIDEGKFDELEIQKNKNDDEKIVEKLSASIQVNHQDLQSNHASNVYEKNQSAEISLIFQKIHKLSPQKLIEIQKYLDLIENKSINEEIPMISKQANEDCHKRMINKDEKQVNLHNLPQVYSTNTFQKLDQLQKQDTKIKAFQKIPSCNDEDLINRNKNFRLIPRNESRKGIRQKKQKASMIYGNSMKSSSRSKIKFDLGFEEEQKPQTENQIYKSENLKPYLTSRRDGSSGLNASEKLVLESVKPLKMEKSNFKFQQKNETQTMKKSSFKQLMNQKQIFEVKMAQNQPKQVHENTNLNIQHSEIKMLNISNKKSLIIKKPEHKTHLKFKILSNRGHPTLFGLTGIELYTIEGKRVLVTEKQLSLNSSWTAKLLFLLNANHYTTQQDNFFQSSLSKNEIFVQLSQENEKIGGILIFNFNKSSLQNSKEVDQLQIYHNDEKMWKGTINPGVYNESNYYATQIQFVPNFKFPTFEKPSKKDEITTKNDKTQFWIEDKQKNQQFSVPEQKEFNENQEKIIQKSENRRKNGSYFETGKNNFAMNLPEQKQPSQQYKKFDIVRLKEDNETKNRVQSFDFEQKTQFQKKPLNAIRQQHYDSFDAMLKGLEQNVNREKNKLKPSPSSNSVGNQYVGVDNKEKNQTQNINFIYQTQIPKQQQKPRFSNNEIDDFMNDSIFNNKPHSRIPTIKRKLEPSKRQQSIKNENPYNFHKKEEAFVENNKDINIDDFLGELEDVMNNKRNNQIKKSTKVQKRFEIPILPIGETVQIFIYENWGHQAYVGLQTIQFLNDDGKSSTPSQINCNRNPQNINLLESLNSKNIMNRDEKIQTKIGFQKSSPTILTFKFNKKNTFSLIRIWNYNGHRVHSNIGIKQCNIKIDGTECFTGQLKMNESTPENFYKNFEAILFTNDHKILKKIKQNDWLTELKSKIKQEKNLFKSTLTNFNRPKTKNSDVKISQKENTKNDATHSVSKEIKLPKRACWQYEPPQMPEGKVIVFSLHNTWGDKNFIGLNGIQIYDGTGKMLGKQEILKIRAFPGTTGQKNDKRVIQNVLNGQNFTPLDSNIWLSTFQSDIEKLQSGKPNTIIVQFYKLTKISGINFYNYSKTPQRGVRQIEIQVNGFIAFRGYLKIFNEGSPQNTLHTTINFTKNLQLLEKMNYEGYNEDNIDQNVSFVNQRKLIKV